MHDTAVRQDTAVRPRGRFRRTAAAGITLGALFGISFTISSGRAVAERPATSARPMLDATHVPPLLTTTGEEVALRYDAHCASAAEGREESPCDVGGAVFVRTGMSGSFRRVPLALDASKSEGRYIANVPPSIVTSRRGFSYYAVIEAGAGDTTLTLPGGGAEAPHRSLPLGRAVEVSLGGHEFGREQRADERVAEARWGNAATEVGLEGGPNVAPVGGSAFDVDAAGNVFVLDQVNRRVLRWTTRASAPSVVPVSVDGTIADLSVAANGRMYVLEAAQAGRGPVLRTLDRSGRALGVAEIRERTATQVRLGPSGPLVLQHPSGQWHPVSGTDGEPRSASEGDGVGLPGRVLPGGDEVIVLRIGNEIRVALAKENIVRRSWRVTSATPLAEVQLAEPLGDGLLVVVRVYTDTNDEFVALLLGARGLLGSASLESADWAESAPLSRFRLSGQSLYQLGSTKAGLFVNRFDLEVK